MALIGNRFSVIWFTSDQSLQQSLQFELIRCTFRLSADYHLKNFKLQIVDNHVLSICGVICILCWCKKSAIIHKYCLTIFVEMQVKFNFQWFLHMGMLQNLRIRLKAPRHSQVTTVRKHWVVVICFMLRSNKFLGASPGNQDTPMLVFKIWKYIMDRVA